MTGLWPARGWGDADFRRIGGVATVSRKKWPKMKLGYAKLNFADLIGHFLYSP